MKTKFYLLGIIVLFLFSCSGDEIQDLTPMNVPDPVSLPNEELLINRDVNILTQEDALKVSKLFRRNETSTRANVSEHDEINLITDDSNSPLMYIINYQNEEGFSIVSASKSYTPIIAYSENGNFTYDENMPDNVKVWLDMTKEDITTVVNQNETQKKDFQWLEYEKPSVLDESTRNSDIRVPIRQWYLEGYVPIKLKDFHDYDQDLAISLYNDIYRYVDYYGRVGIDIDEYTYVLIKLSTVQNQIGPLMTSKWSQTNNFNAACVPLGTNAPAGCTAIALAQIMNYHRFPAQFDWDNMADNQATRASQNLISHIGVAIKMKYNASGSSAYNTDVVSALNNIYNYHGSLENVNKFSFSKFSFTDGPAYVSGNRKTADNKYVGHAWVCDGYRDTERVYDITFAYPDGFLHEPAYYSYFDRREFYVTRFKQEGNEYLSFNWGHGGRYDGWFINGETNMTNDRDYKYSKQMIYPLRPRR